MAVADTLACYYTTTITALKSFIVRVQCYKAFLVRDLRIFILSVC